MITKAFNFNEAFHEALIEVHNMTKELADEGTVMVNEVDLPEFEFDDVDFSTVSRIILHPNGDVEIFNKG